MSPPTEPEEEPPYPAAWGAHDAQGPHVAYEIFF